MPRRSRIHSHSHIYHVMLRGIERKQIFYDAEDYSHFTEILVKLKKRCGFTLHAYCLMGNHIHLLIEEGEEELSMIFRRLGAAFVYWYNVKYERTGHLFQDRYKSEPVDSERYYLTVLRYIIRNPVQAGLCESLEEYEYSSGREYLLSERGITDTAFCRKLINAEQLREYLGKDNDDHCMEMDSSVRIRITDQRAKELILHEFGTYSPSPGKTKDREAFNASICRLLHSGLSIRQLSRLAGVSKKVIENAKK